jgi:hypothetical protein
MGEGQGQIKREGIAFQKQDIKSKEEKRRTIKSDCRKL